MAEMGSKKLLLLCKFCVLFLFNGSYGSEDYPATKPFSDFERNYTRKVCLLALPFPSTLLSIKNCYIIITTPNNNNNNHHSS